MPDAKVVEKILRTLVEKFTYVVCAIEESNDIKELLVDALQSSLLVHEQKLSKHVNEEHALKVEGQGRSDDGRGRGGYQGRGRGGYQGRGGHGRGSSSFNKDAVECYKCHKLGHFKYECPSWERNANYAELDEDMLLMVHISQFKGEDEQVWFLDFGCSNHMSGNKNWFIDLDNNFRQNVKLGDDRRMVVEGKGSLRLQINGSVQTITSVYYVPGLKNNLLIVGQLQQRGLRIIIEDDMCEIWHKKQRKMIMYSTMSTNRMFVIYAAVKIQEEHTGERCLHASTEKVEEIWHKRLGHLSHKSMQILAGKEMVRGRPKINGDGAVCEICMKGKQILTNIPKQSMWRPNRGLGLVHSKIRGPISLTSESGRRYIINFIDDCSRKC